MNALQITIGLTPTSTAVRRSRAWRSLVVGIAIVTLHVAITVLMVRGTSRLKIDEVPVMPIVANVVELQTSSFLSLDQELEPAKLAVAIRMPTLPLDSHTMEAALQPPIIDPEMHLDVSAYSARALLPAGSVAAVILLLDIGSNGSVLSAKVTRSDASEAAKEAAVDYALATRWIPGSVDGEPTAMQASLTVILGERT